MNESELSRGNVRVLKRPLAILMAVIGTSVALVLMCPSVSLGKVVRFEIKSREPFADGKSFGNAGTYERIVGRVHYELDPDLARNKNVVDLQFAPRNEHGGVELFGDLFILAPRDLSRGNGAIFYDVNNRGRLLALAFFNYGPQLNDPRTEEHAGDGFLLRQGFTIVWSGWDGELLPGDHRLRLAPPVAREGDRPITGLVRCEVVPDSDSSRISVTRDGHGSYRPTARAFESATLTHRRLINEPRVLVPRDRWTLQVTDIQSDAPHQLPLLELEMAAGFIQGHIYELIYEAQDPLVHGTCFTALRDLISAFKYGGGHDNPLLINGEPVIQRAHGFGVSQSGRFLREFLYSGFNADENGRQVFDGLIPHVSGGGLGSFNHRFAQPTRFATQHESHDYPTDRFPFTYETQTDPLTGRSDGILQRSVASGTAPFVMHTQSAAEYWTRSGSLVHTDPLGGRDANIPSNVRIYQFGGTQHGPSDFPPARGKGKYLANPGDYKPFLRTLILALDKWCRDGTAAPPSVYPSLASGNLVDWKRESTGFPIIPGVAYPQVIRQPSLLDLGAQWFELGIISRQPPIPRAEYRVRAARCDEDGNELGCLLPPEVAVPVATYTGWNPRSKEANAEDQLVSLNGSYIPFPITKAEREAARDPRLSLQERYGDLETYVRELQNVCDELANSGYLLAEDVERIPRIQRERVASLFAKLNSGSDQAALRVTK